MPKKLMDLAVGQHHLAHQLVVGKRPFAEEPECGLAVLVQSIEHRDTAPPHPKQTVGHGPGPHATPLVMGDRVFAVGFTGRLRCRRDWLVRCVEIVVVAAWWWMPLVYLLRRGLRRSEELCCDSWVMTELPDSSTSYAGAIVATTDLTTPSPSPASGVGPIRQLRDRVHMLQSTITSRSLRVRGRLVVLALAVVLWHSQFRTPSSSWALEIGIVAWAGLGAWLLAYIISASLHEARS